MARPRTFARTIPSKRDLQAQIETLKQDVLSWKRRCGAAFERGHNDIRSRDLILSELLWLLSLWPVKLLLFLLHPWILRRRKIRPLLLIRKTKEQVEGSIKAGYNFWNEYRLANAEALAKEKRRLELGRLASVLPPAPAAAPAGPLVALEDGEEPLRADAEERGDAEAGLGAARPPAKDVG